MAKQNTILRCTINLEPDNQIEAAFVRALLTRLNVLSAKTKPKDALDKILAGRKLREALDDSRKRQASMRQNVTTERNGAVIVEPTQNKALTVTPTATTLTRNQSGRWASSKIRVLKIFERSMVGGSDGNSEEKNNGEDFLLDGGEIL